MTIHLSLALSLGEYLFICTRTSDEQIFPFPHRDVYLFNSRSFPCVRVFSLSCVDVDRFILSMLYLIEIRRVMQDE